MSFLDDLKKNLGINDFISKLKPPTSIPKPSPLVSTIANKGMEFRVGAGMTPEQTKTAYEAIRKPEAVYTGDYPSATRSASNLLDVIKKEFSPRTEPVEFRPTFQLPEEAVQTKAPPIVTQLAAGGRSLLELPFQIISTIGGEIKGRGKPEEVKANVDLRRFGFTTPNYQTAAKEQQDAINRGENPWISGLGIVSDKSLSFLFGGQIVGDLAKLTSNILLRGGVQARLEAQSFLDAYKENQKAIFDRVKNEPLAQREKVLADLANTKAQAEQVIKEQGKPTLIDQTRANASRYTEVLSRQTKIADLSLKEGSAEKLLQDLKSAPGRIARPDYELKTPVKTTPRVDAKQLPGYRERPGQAPAFGLSTREVEKVGYKENMKSFNDLPDYAKGAIQSDIRAKVTNEGLSPDVLRNLSKTYWIESEKKVADLLKINPEVAGPQFTERKIMSKGPIVLDKNGIAIDGNNRLRQAWKKGDETIQVYEPVDESKLTSSKEDSKKQIEQIPQTQPDIPPPPNEVLSYGDTIPQEERERKLLTSLKDNPKYADTFKDTIDNYDQISNKASISKAEDLLANSPEEAMKLALSNSISLEAQAVRITLMENAVARGDFEEVSRLANATKIAQRATEAGQAVQINRILGGNIDTPVKAIVTAEKSFNDFIQEEQPEFGKAIDQVAKDINQANEEVIDKVIKETPELKPKKTALEEKIDKRDVPPEEELAHRITPYYTAQQPNAVKDMINTLYKVAEEVLPKKGKAVPRDAIELIGQALRDRATYKDIWVKAQEIVKEKYAGDDEAIALLDTYFKKIVDGEELPVAVQQINNAVKQEIRAQEIDLSKIVKEHFTVAEQAGKDLTLKLIQKANIPPVEADILAKKIQVKFKELIQKRKESILNRIFAERKLPVEKSFVDRIVELTNLGAFDKAEFRNQLAKQLGLPALDKELAKKLSDQANKIQALPKGYERYKATEDLMKLISDQIPVSKKEIMGQLLNIPRTIMSSFDLSFPFRQGVFVSATFPKEFGTAFKKQFGQFIDEKNYEAVMDSIIKNPDFNIAQDAGLSFTNVSEKMLEREERFMSSYAERIWLVGHVIKASGRAYTGTANKLRMDVFSSMLRNAEEAGLNPQADKKLLEAIADFINTATGRGSLGKSFEKSAVLLNSLFFSPRLMASRLTLLNPLYYIKADPFTRKQALKSLLGFTGLITTVLGVAHLAGADVGVDPRSSDFGKIKIDNTRVDIMGGFQQYIRMAAQLITGKYVSTTTGRIATLGEGYKPLTRLDIIMRGLETKESPILSFVVDMIRGENFMGEKTHTLPGVTDALVSRLTPMISSTLIDIYKDNPKLLPLGLASAFGFGVQTYPMAPQIIEMKRIESSEDPNAEFAALKKRDRGLWDKVRDAKIQSTYIERDWDLQAKGVTNGDRARAILKEFNKLDTTEEKSALEAELKKKKILTDTVYDQLKILLKE